VTLVFVADLAKMGAGSDDNKKNTANIDVGYISQNVYLFCASEGLVTGARGSVDRTALGPGLKLRPDQMIIWRNPWAIPSLERHPSPDRSSFVANPKFYEHSLPIVVCGSIVPDPLPAFAGLRPRPTVGKLQPL